MYSFKSKMCANRAQPLWTKPLCFWKATYLYQYRRSRCKKLYSFFFHRKTYHFFWKYRSFAKYLYCISETFQDKGFRARSLSPSVSLSISLCFPLSLTLSLNMRPCSGIEQLEAGAGAQQPGYHCADGRQAFFLHIFFYITGFPRIFF